MHLKRACLTQHLDDLPRGIAAHDRIINYDQLLAADDLRQRVELKPQPLLAQLLAGLDEGSCDVTVLDEAVVLGQPALSGETARGGVAGVGDGDHEVGAGGWMLARQRLTHPPARSLQHGAVHLRVGASEVDVFEEAEGFARSFNHHLSANPVGADRHHLTRQHVAHVGGADDV